MGTTARRAFVVSVVAVAVVAGALAVWELRLLIALLLYGLAIAAAMRPGVEWLARRRVPRPLGIAVHYIALLGLLGVLLWLAVPAAIHQIQAASPHARAARVNAAPSSSRTGSRSDRLYDRLAEGGRVFVPLGA